MIEKPQGYRLSSIEFSDGSVVEIDRNSIILLTGPNNCGKSRTLKEISYHPVLSSVKRVTRSINSTFEGDFLAAVNEVMTFQHMKPNGPHVQQLFAQSGGNPQLFLTLLSSNQHLYKTFANAVMCHLSTLNRLISFGIAPENAHIVNVQPFGITPLNRLYEENEIAKKVYEYTRAAFGRGVVMNHASLQDPDLYFVDEFGE